jgi:hypothetical protein
MAAVPKVSTIEMVVATIERRNCLKEESPLPALSVLGVCNLTFIMLEN